MKDLRIVYLGTPDFAVASLDILVKNGYNIAGVVTAPDKPSGRGQKMSQSAVKEYALAHNLKVLQPEKLKAPEFLDELRALNATLQIVVAFRMLPEAVWNMPVLGTFNLHGSLLPQYRGAAPINRAVMNGEKETGVTTFFLRHEIDTGSIIFQESTPIGPDETAGELHDRLMDIGAGLVLKTVKAIESGEYPRLEQNTLQEGGLKHAPKLFKDDCKIDWTLGVDAIHNFIRGLSPYPTAFSSFRTPAGEELSLKIFRSEKEKTAHSFAPGHLLTDHKTFLKAAAQDGFIYLREVQLQGKKRMLTEEFLRGFRVEEFIQLV
jgi:methionyl-tRNA formyltransferase